MKSNKKTITISDELYDNLKQLGDNSGFEDSGEFINFILQEVVNNQTAQERELSDIEKEEVDKGLKELGYKS